MVCSVSKIEKVRTSMKALSGLASKKNKEKSSRTLMPSSERETYCISTCNTMYKQQALELEAKEKL